MSPPRQVYMLPARIAASTASGSRLSAKTLVSGEQPRRVVEVVAQLTGLVGPLLSRRSDVAFGLVGAAVDDHQIAQVTMRVGVAGDVKRPALRQ
jgi:hypothetical protein